MPLGSSPYFVYIASCSDGTLYVGSTSDVLERERVHNEGRGAKYTAGRLPVRVVYSEGHKSRSAAEQREAQLKRWSRAKKQALIAGTPTSYTCWPNAEAKACEDWRNWSRFAP